MTKIVNTKRNGSAPSNVSQIVQRFAVSALTVIALGAGATIASEGDVFIDARLDVRAVGSDLAEDVAALQASQSRPQWVSWVVPAIDPESMSCCFRNWDDGGQPAVCNLESGNRFSGHHDGDRRRGGDLRVLVRLFEGEVDELRAYSENCPLDAGDRKVTMLTGVTPSDSVGLLESYVNSNDRRDADAGMMIIARTDGAAADRAMERFASTDAPQRLREKAAFWLGAAREEKGFSVLKRMLREERNEDMLDKVVFGISVSDASGSEDVLLNLARNDKRAEVRKKALFWVAQKAGERAAETLTEAVEGDPDADVREHAVFALSQLSGGRGVPLLLDLARNNQHPEVRRQAMFWLGQSGDARALDLFEEILEQ